ncbi:MAG: IS982 family transposase [Bacteroidales bacterium]|nr:IS982 family transposase [Bacteroidales bacterium]
MQILNEDKLIQIFCMVDDFCNEYSRNIQQYELGVKSKNRKVPEPQMCISEIMTIEILYHLSGHKCFKYYYLQMVEPSFKEYFPNLLSYNRVVELKPRINLYLFAFINLCLLGYSTGVSYLDSTKLVVCHNLRIHSNKVFKGIAKRGKTSNGWFFGLKLHLIINHLGEIVSFWLTPGNVADNSKNIVVKMCANLFDKLFGDKDYISKELFAELFEKGIELFTTIRRNMKNKLINIENNLFLIKRGVVESVIELLKSACNIEHSRHRSPVNAIINIWGAIAAYHFFKRKPSVLMTKIIYHLK